jgi:hypothetical protein
MGEAEEVAARLADRSGVGAPPFFGTTRVDEAGSMTDTFRLVTATGYGAFGVVDRGNVTVSGGSLLPAP